MKLIKLLVKNFKIEKDIGKEIEELLKKNHEEIFRVYSFKAEVSNII